MIENRIRELEEQVSSLETIVWVMLGFPPANSISMEDFEKEGKYTLKGKYHSIDYTIEKEKGRGPYLTKVTVSLHGSKLLEYGKYDFRGHTQFGRVINCLLDYMETYGC